MDTQPTPKIIGAFVIGFALVAGAYVLSNFGQPTGLYETPPESAQTQQAAPIRTAIAVTDENDNGIEDWRDEFVTSDPIVLSESTQAAVYEAPTTLTGQAGINFMEDIVRSRSLGLDDSLAVQDTINLLQAETSVSIYDTPDILTISVYDEQTIKTYANNLATAIIENNETDLDYELLILRDIVNRRDETRLQELTDLAEVYRLTRDAVLAVPVPAPFAKQHLDIINTLHARHHDILGMTYSFEDPAYALLRLQRYESGLFGMIQSLENMYTSLEPYAGLFTAEDPAVFFTQFSPANRIRI